MSKLPLIALSIAFLLAGFKALPLQEKLGGDGPLPSDAEMKKEGLSDHQIESLHVVRGEKWWRKPGEDAMDGTALVGFITYGQPVAPKIKSESGIPITLMCTASTKKKLISLETGPALNGNVMLRFDDAPVINQNWLKATSTMFSREPKTLFQQILKAKTFKIGFATPSGDFKVYLFHVLDLKDLVAKEPLCN